MDWTTLWMQIVSLAIALINSQLARSKGRSGIVWFFVSFPLGLLATVLILVWPRPRQSYFQVLRAGWSKSAR